MGTPGAGCVFSLRFLLACSRLAHATLPRFPFRGIGPLELPARTPTLLVAHKLAASTRRHRVIQNISRCLFGLSIRRPSPQNSTAITTHSSLGIYFQNGCIRL